MQGGVLCVFLWVGLVRVYKRTREHSCGVVDRGTMDRGTVAYAVLLLTLRGSCSA